MKKIFTVLFIIFALTGCASEKHYEDYEIPRRVTRASEINYAYSANNESAIADDFAEKEEIIGEFSTKYNEKAKGRSKNIQLAAERLNDTLIMPNEEFSYNDVVGPTTKDKGFKLARIFVRGKNKEGYGGGVCQVSSTLYNAALEAKMEITERHPHSKDVNYVDDGLDAAVSYGGIDLKFRNTSDRAVRINANAANGEIRISITAV